MSEAPASPYGAFAIDKIISSTGRELPVMDIATQHDIKGALSDAVGREVVGITDLLAINDDGNAYVASFHSGYESIVDNGGGVFDWFEDMPKSRHNGGTVISPTCTFDGTFEDLPSFLSGRNERGAGSGCWVRRVSNGVITPQMFGAVPGLKNTVHQSANIAALSAFVLSCMDDHYRGYIPAGEYYVNGNLPRTEGVTITGNGSGFWRATPFSWATEDVFIDANATRIILCGTGPKNTTIEGVTESRQNGFDRPNPERPYNNEYDADFLMFDGTNRDANRASPATAKQLSTFWEIADRDDVGINVQPVYISGISIVLSCPGSDEEEGLRGYGVQDAIVPFASWDIGFLVRAGSMSVFEDVSAVGYWDERGAIIMPGNSDDTAQGQGEHFRWDGGYIQGGVAYRGGDVWPIYQKDTSSIKGANVQVRWTPSHQFSPSGGTVRLSSGQTVSYKEAAFFEGSIPRIALILTNPSDLDLFTVGSTTINMTRNAGISHSSLNNMYIADQGYSQRILGPNPELGNRQTQYRAALEASGDPCRALKLNNVTPMCAGPVAYHFGRAQNVEMRACYTEPKAWKLSANGSSNTQGSLFIAGPRAAMAAENGPGNDSSLESWGGNFAGHVIRSPLVTPPSSARLSGMQDVFNPSYYLDSRIMFNSSLGNAPGLPNNDFIIQGLNNKDIGLYRREASGTTKRVIRGFNSGTVGLGETDAAISLFASGNVQFDGSPRPTIDNRVSLGGSSNRWSQIYAGTGTINTSDKREKQQQRSISDAERSVAQRLKGMLRMFKFNNAVDEKGDGARWHFGAMAQEVAEAFEAEGLNANEYAMFCHDQWDEQQEIFETDDDGNREVFQKHIPAGDRYGVRYDQLCLFIIAAV